MVITSINAAEDRHRISHVKRLQYVAQTGGKPENIQYNEDALQKAVLKLSGKSKKPANKEDGTNRKTGIAKQIRREPCLVTYYDHSVAVECGRANCRRLKSEFYIFFCITFLILFCADKMVAKKDLCIRRRCCVVNHQVSGVTSHECSTNSIIAQSLDAADLPFQYSWTHWKCTTPNQRVRFRELGSRRIVLDRCLKPKDKATVKADVARAHQVKHPQVITTEDHYALARALRRRRREKAIKKARKVKKLEREAREKARKAALMVTHKGGMPAAKKADDSGDSDTDSEFGPEEDLGNEEVGDGEVQDQSDDEELPIIATLNDVEEEDNEEDEDNDEEDELEEAI